MHILTLLWRLIVLSVSLIVCTTVVSVAGLYAIVNRILLLDPSTIDVTTNQALHSFDDFLVFFVTLIVVAAHAFTPWILAIAVTEIMRWRHLVVHLAAGAIVAVAAAVTSGVLLVSSVAVGSGTTGRALAVIAALGFLGGFVHWLIAGRNAGRWSQQMLEPDRTLPPNEGPRP